MMAGYDRMVSQYSPEGRVYQVEYAHNATLRSGTAIGMIGSDGIVLAVENITASPLYESGSNLRSFGIDQHIGAVVAGFLPDARNIVNAARDEASEFRHNFGCQAPLTHITETVSGYIHSHTLISGVRPFGASLILGAYVPKGPKIYCIKPCGAALGYLGCAIGKAAEEARLEMENIDYKNTPIVRLVNEAARVIYEVHNDETNFELELSWAGKQTNGKYELVPPRVQKNAEDYAIGMMEQEESSGSE